MRPVFLSLLAVFLVAGCEDPSNVGLGLVGDGDSEPVRYFLAGADLPSERNAIVTGGINAGVGFSGATRFLTGVADDPIFGLLEATGYFDFATPLAIGNNFRDGTPTAVSLHFLGDGYAYGDTVSTTVLTVSETLDAWTAFGTTSDTTLATGDAITSVDYIHSSGELVISLPKEWIDENADVLLDLNFTDLFNGFAISASGAAAISGFLGLPSFMRVTTTTGSVDFPMSKLLTTLVKSNAPTIPGRSQVQDGYGDGAVLDFDFEVDSIAGSAISRTVIKVRADLSIFDSPPPDFVRPVPTSLSLIGIRPDGSRVLLQSSSIPAEGPVRFVSTTANPGENTMVRSVQLAVVGESQFEKYAITVVESQASIGAALVYNASADEDVPEAVVTLTRTPF